jgi:phosphoribosylaminoimidazolecarboxamide formyltransferase / IMP cyclohydrolase
LNKLALLSVADKRGIVDLGRGLSDLGYTLASTGGTAKALRDAGLAVRDVSDMTGFPEMLGGRVKTLHPAVHGGILARRTAQDNAELSDHGIAAIDLVVVNLYPFEATVARSGATLADAIEDIDIGGVTLLRAAAKNHAHVGVVCDPASYDGILAEMKQNGELSTATRRNLAYAAFAHTAAYDAAISTYFYQQGFAGDEVYPPAMRMAFDKVRDLRYGENPHQSAALYAERGAAWPGLAQAKVLQGKELSFNNMVDLESAWTAAAEHSEPAIIIIKHSNPCGAATAPTLAEAYAAAVACDPVSAYGSVVAANRELDQATATAMGKLFIEAIVAPGYEPAALEKLARKKDCRIVQLEPPSPMPKMMDFRRLRGGLLVQDYDTSVDDPSAWRTVTRRAPTAEEMHSLVFAWRVAKHVKSNAIVLARGTATVGIGAGQMSRVDSVGLAVDEAGEKAKGSVVGSDAFFPFADGVEKACRAGVTAIAQPGGSLHDPETIAAADAAGAAMVFTGVRHFWH